MNYNQENHPNPDQSQDLNSQGSSQNEECVLCFNEFDEGIHYPMIINCAHTICDACIKEYKAKAVNQSKHFICPFCRFKDHPDKIIAIKNRSALAKKNSLKSSEQISKFSHPKPPSNSVSSAMYVSTNNIVQLQNTQSELRRDANQQQIQVQLVPFVHITNQLDQRPQGQIMSRKSANLGVDDLLQNDLQSHNLPSNSSNVPQQINQMLQNQRPAVNSNLIMQQNSIHHNSEGKNQQKNVPQSILPYNYGSIDNSVMNQKKNLPQSILLSNFRINDNPVMNQSLRQQSQMHSDQNLPAGKDLMSQVDYTNVPCQADRYQASNMMRQTASSVQNSKQSSSHRKFITNVPAIYQKQVNLNFGQMNIIEQEEEKGESQFSYAQMIQEDSSFFQDLSSNSIDQISEIVRKNHQKQQEQLLPPKEKSYCFCQKSQMQLTKICLTCQNISICENCLIEKHQGHCVEDIYYQYTALFKILSSEQLTVQSDILKTIAQQQESDVNHSQVVLHELKASEDEFQKSKIPSLYKKFFDILSGPVYDSKLFTSQIQKQSANLIERYEKLLENDKLHKYTEAVALLSDFQQNQENIPDGIPCYEMRLPINDMGCIYLENYYPVLKQYFEQNQIEKRYNRLEKIYEKILEDLYTQAAINASLLLAIKLKSLSEVLTKPEKEWKYSNIAPLPDFTIDESYELVINSVFPDKALIYQKSGKNQFDVILQQPIILIDIPMNEFKFAWIQDAQGMFVQNYRAYFIDRYVLYVGELIFIIDTFLNPSSNITNLIYKVNGSGEITHKVNLAQISKVRFSVVADADQIYFVGGADNQQQNLRFIQTYKLLDNMVAGTLKLSINSVRNKPMLAIKGNYLFVCGGTWEEQDDDDFGEQFVSTIEILDVLTGQHLIEIPVDINFKVGLGADSMLQLYVLDCNLPQFTIVIIHSNKLNLIDDCDPESRKKLQNDSNEIKQILMPKYKSEAIVLDESKQQYDWYQLENRNNNRSQNKQPSVRFSQQAQLKNSLVPYVFPLLDGDENGQVQLATVVFNQEFLFKNLVVEQLQIQYLNSQTFELERFDPNEILKTYLSLLNNVY
eukprot:403361416